MAKSHQGPNRVLDRSMIAVCSSFFETHKTRVETYSSCQRNSVSKVSSIQSKIRLVTTRRGGYRVVCPNSVHMIQPLP